MDSAEWRVTEHSKGTEASTFDDFLDVVLVARDGGRDGARLDLTVESFEVWTQRVDEDSGRCLDEMLHRRLGLVKLALIGQRKKDERGVPAKGR